MGLSKCGEVRWVRHLEFFKTRANHSTHSRGVENHDRHHQNRDKHQRTLEEIGPADGIEPPEECVGNHNGRAEQQTCGVGYVEHGAEEFPARNKAG